jgi:hypothetical protein
MSVISSPPCEMASACASKFSDRAMYRTISIHKRASAAHHPPRVPSQSLHRTIPGPKEWYGARIGKELVSLTRRGVCQQALQQDTCCSSLVCLLHGHLDHLWLEDFFQPSHHVFEFSSESDLYYVWSYAILTWMVHDRVIDYENALILEWNSLLCLNLSL